VLRDTFGDGNDERNLGFNSFEDGLSTSTWRNIDDTGIGLGGLGSLYIYIYKFTLFSLSYYISSCFLTSRTVPKTGRPRWV
jgi:hypothetical protein